MAPFEAEPEVVIEFELNVARVTAFECGVVRGRMVHWLSEAKLFMVLWVVEFEVERASWAIKG